MQIGQMEPEAKIARHAAPAASPKGDAPSPAQLADAAGGDELREARLLRAMRGGDRATAIGLIDELYGEGLYRFIHAMVRKDDAADDVYQMTLLEAFRDLGTFAERSALRTWLFGIARHRCLDALKVDRRRDARFVAEGELSEAAGVQAHADAAPSALDRLGQAELVAALGHCLDELSAELRMVLLMRFSEGMAYDEISRVCRASVETLRARVSRSLPVLRRCVEQKGAL
jgi:RNA polymerase sigma factor (sigma-70 family)